MISEIGYESLLTDDPEGAVRRVRSGICRVILADVHLPGVHAYELLDRLLRVDPGIHVIIITKEYTTESALKRYGVGPRIFCQSRRWIACG
jgi:DNA-binding NarL/FixJ family response regulator